MIDEKTTYRIMDLAEGKRKREQLANLGTQSLPNAELIAILS